MDVDSPASKLSSLLKGDINPQIDEALMVAGNLFSFLYEHIEQVVVSFIKGQDSYYTGPTIQQWKEFYDHLLIKDHSTLNKSDLVSYQNARYSLLKVTNKKEIAGDPLTKLNEYINYIKKLS